MKPLSKFLNKARRIVRYYRVGPLGDVPSVNGKLMEEALRKVMTDAGLGRVSTSGLVDLGVTQWGLGFQVKTYRKKSNVIIFSRSDKKSKRGRIEDMKNRVVQSLKKIGIKELYLLDIDTFTSEFSVYHLASIKADGSLRTYGSFLKDGSVRVNLSQTHFNILKDGLLKVA